MRLEENKICFSVVINPLTDEHELIIHRKDQKLRIELWQCERGDKNVYERMIDDKVILAFMDISNTHEVDREQEE